MFAKIYRSVIIDFSKIAIVVICCALSFFLYFSKDFKLDASSDSLLLESDKDLKYLTLVQSLERDDLKSMYETPEAQKRFAELGQDYFKTWLGKSEKVNLKECQ